MGDKIDGKTRTVGNFQKRDGVALDLIMNYTPVKFRLKSYMGH